MVLAGLVAGEVLALRVDAQALLREEMSDTVDPGVGLGVREPPLPPDQDFLVRHRPGDGVEDR